MYRSLLIIDDFYPKPHEVRAAALAADYPVVDGPRTFPGRNSVKSLEPDGLEQVISQLVGEKLVKVTDKGVNHCHFRTTLEGEQSRYMVHVDPNHLTWVGVIYLSAPETCCGGTEFYRHKALASDRSPVEQSQLDACGVATVAELLARDGNDADAWQHLMTIPMRFNRLALYRPWMWHSAAPGFGSSLDDGRLIQLVAFRPAGPRR